MAVGDKISRASYNDIQTTVANILGTGSSNRGYGQPVVSSPVTVRDSITVNEWNNLANDLKTIGRHQNGTTPSLPLPGVNDIVKFNSSSEPYTRYETVANAYDANRFALGALQFITENKGSQSREFSWRDEAECTITISFDTAEEARHFFNSGSLIRISSSRSGGTTSGNPSTIALQNNSWTSLLTTAGEIDFGGGLPGTGVDPNNGQNYFRCRNTFDTYNTETDSSPYGANDWFLQAATPGVADNSNGTASTLQIKSVWNDGHVPIGRATVDGVDGTLSIFVATVEARGTLTPSGNLFQVSSPTVTFSAITGS